MKIPLSIERAAGEIAASGRFEILQSDFGMVPMSILGGAITVVDRLEVRFSVLAKAR